MKIVYYDGLKIRLHKGETLAKVNTFYEGKQWVKTGIELCIIKEHYFKNGNPKRGDFEIVETLKTIQKGYGYHYNVRGQNYDLIERGE